MSERLRERSRKEKVVRRPQRHGEVYNPNHIVRNLTLGAATLGLAILITVGVCNSQVASSDLPQFAENAQSIFIQQSEASYSFPAAVPTSITTRGTKALDTKYLQDLLETLQKDRGNKLSRAQEVVRKFSRIGYEDPSFGRASALKLDESGIFLTAAHVLVDKANNFKPTGIYVETPTEGPNAFRVQGAVFDYERDIALIYAPTGKERRLNPSIQFRGSLQAGEKGWLIGTKSRFPNNSEVAITTGIYNPNSTLYNPILGHLPFEGMMPFGGSSGGPVIDSEGRVIGVVGGFLSVGNDAPINTLNTLGDYKGTAVSSVDLLSELVKKPIRNL